MRDTPTPHGLAGLVGSTIDRICGVKLVAGGNTQRGLSLPLGTSSYVSKENESKVNRILF